MQYRPTQYRPAPRVDAIQWYFPGQSPEWAAPVVEECADCLVVTRPGNNRVRIEPGSWIYRTVTVGDDGNVSTFVNALPDEDFRLAFEPAV